MAVANLVTGCLSATDRSLISMRGAELQRAIGSHQCNYRFVNISRNFELPLAVAMLFGNGVCRL